MYSIILTIHNKENLIREVLLGILKNTISNYELIIVFDGCTDNSVKIVVETLNNWDFLTKYVPSTVKLLYADNVFETRANNLGLKSAEGTYSIIVQDDCIIKEYGWNTRMSKPCEAWNDIFAVTSRTAHNWEFNLYTTHYFDEKYDRNDCWSDIVIHTEHKDRNNTPRNIFAIRDSVNRGPLLLRSDRLKELGYLDEQCLKQDMDDHILMFKAYKDHQWKCGVYWIDFESRNEWGGTRKEDGNPHPWLFESNQHNTKIFYGYNKDMIGNHHNEDRILE